MKRKIKLIDKKAGVIIEKEINERNLMHFETQLKAPKNNYPTKYSRKQKHKKSYFEE